MTTLEWIRDNYDINKSRYIEKDEYDIAENDYMSGSISMMEYMAVVDAYNNHTLLPSYTPPPRTDWNIILLIAGATLGTILLVKKL